MIHLGVKYYQHGLNKKKNQLMYRNLAKTKASKGTGDDNNTRLLLKRC